MIAFSIDDLFGFVGNLSSGVWLVAQESLRCCRVQFLRIRVEWKEQKSLPLQVRMCIGADAQMVYCVSDLPLKSLFSPLGQKLKLQSGETTREEKHPASAQSTPSSTPHSSPKQKSR